MAKSEIAVWLNPNLSEAAASKVLEGIRTVIVPPNWHLVVGNSLSVETSQVDRAFSEFVFSSLENPNLAGAIFCPTGDPSGTSSYQRLSDANVSVVYIDHEPPEPIKADVVATNHRRAARNAVQHLIDLGHRDVAVIYGDYASRTRDRLDGYHDAFKERGLRLRSELVIGFIPQSSACFRRDLSDTIRRLLELAQAPTAIFTLDNEVTLQICREAQLGGLSIPRDVSLVGFDVSTGCILPEGDLTTLVQPFDEIGRIAGERLLERIQASTQQACRHILLEAPLVVGASTAAPQRRR